MQRLELPELSEVGLQLMEATSGVGSRRKEACWETPFNVAVRVTVTVAATTLVVATKVLEMAPAATVTEAGMDSTALFADNDTLLPADGAG